MADTYWNKLFCQSYVYEPEIEKILKLFNALDYYFLDLGANHGYWSILVSSDHFR